ncbi:DUF4326 domain-containing protein [Paracoccus aminophilus]|uniref:DUF4326 domain-containing protein n=1 Tax=Paracoccus aminophilus JCM 7686 TaxID=1367847 RepID=S5YCD9_PARAH|nr:DUF4326 domain-containing protein [Paracoccus aminophilus]AGT09088.1 hypothetical protein JCM7686_1987 [Paracoccus aminophilus JCM 7686]
MTASKQDPQRIQRKRTKGWRMPEGAVSVCRPSIWGNPFTVANLRAIGIEGPASALSRICVDEFEGWLAEPSLLPECVGPVNKASRQRILDNLPSLRGKDLACWCRLDQPCHADLLLRLANEVVA